jgi:hypothetical protein
MKTVVTQLQTELPGIDTIFTDGRWKGIGPSAERAYGFYPNRMYHNASFRLAAVVVERHRTGPEFYLSTAATFHLIKAIEIGRIEHGFAVLKERGLWRVLASAHINQVWANVQGHTPHTGTHNRYWIIDVSFQIAKPMMPF